VCFIGAAAPVAASIVTGEPMTLKAEFFTWACYPFTLALAAALIGCNTRLKPQTFALLIATVLGMGGVLAFTGFPTPDALANLGLPLLITAGFVIGYQSLRLLLTGHGSARRGGKMLVHLSIIIVLLGVFISSAAQVESRPLLATPRSVHDALSSRIVLDKFTLTGGMGSVYFPSHSLVGPEYSRLETSVEVMDGETVYRGSLHMDQYLNHGVVSEPLIISTPEKDLYVSLHATNSSYNSLLHALVDEMVPPQDVVVVLKYVPLVWLVWLGLLLMVTGMSALILGELFRKGGAGPAPEEPGPGPGCRR
jgi:cytochrome c biogenesis factor